MHSAQSSELAAHGNQRQSHARPLFARKGLEQRSMQSLQPHISRGAIAVSKITRAASKKGAVKMNLKGEYGVRQQGGREAHVSRTSEALHGTSNGKALQKKIPATASLRAPSGNRGRRGLYPEMRHD
jgi:hypothetical protein